MMHVFVDVEPKKIDDGVYDIAVLRPPVQILQVDGAGISSWIGSIG